jgi:DNA repair exonuclease SbcCD ATPase subunit
MASHHAELRGWLDRLGQIGETLTAHVVSGWEKIDEQLRVRQDQQLELLAQWASSRQREASDELAETQRALLRDFRTSLEGMAAEARRIQEEGAHRLDDQLAAIERLHRRIQEEQQSAVVAHRDQTQALSAAGEQLARTLARVRGEASEVRDESARRFSEFAAQIQEIARSAQDFQRGLAEAGDSQTRTLHESGDRLAATLARVDEQLSRFEEASSAHLAAGVAQMEALDRARAEARRRDGELRDAQTAALVESSERLARTLSELRAEARSVQLRVSELADGLAPALAQRVEAVAADFAEPWRRQAAHLDRLHQRLEQATREPEAGDGPPAGGGSRVGRLFRRS